MNYEEKFFNLQDEYGRTKLYRESKQGNYKNVKSLVERGADVNKENNAGTTPLLEACKEGHKKVVKYLLRHGADANRRNKFSEIPLFEAYNEGYYDIVECLIEYGAKVDTKDENGNTLLCWAARQRKDDLVKFLVEHKANVNTRDNKFGMTPLMWAISCKNVKTIDYLAKNGADINNTEDELGRTPFTLACGTRNYEVIECLLNNGADIDILNKNGNTILMESCIKKNIDLVRFLLKHGANMNKENNNKETPAMVAYNSGNPLLIQCFEEVKNNIKKESKENAMKECIKLIVPQGKEIMLKNIKRQEGGINKDKTSIKMGLKEAVVNFLSKGNVGEFIIKKLVLPKMRFIQKHKILARYSEKSEVDVNIEGGNRSKEVKCIEQENSTIDNKLEIIEGSIVRNEPNKNEDLKANNELDNKENSRSGEKQKKENNILVLLKKIIKGIKDWAKGLYNKIKNIFSKKSKEKEKERLAKEVSNKIDKNNLEGSNTQLGKKERNINKKRGVDIPREPIAGNRKVNIGIGNI